MLKKNHFELKYLEDGDYEILSKTDVKDWNRLKKGMELINLDYEFERVPEEKVIILKTGQSRTEQLRIMPETSFEDIQDIIYDKFNKKKVYMEYYNEKEEEKERIESEGDWEEFKKCCYNLDEMKIYDDVNQQ